MVGVVAIVVIADTAQATQVLEDVMRQRGIDHEVHGGGEHCERRCKRGADRRRMRFLRRHCLAPSVRSIFRPDKQLLELYHTQSVCCQEAQP